MLNHKLIFFSLVMLIVTPGCFALGITQEFGEPPEPEIEFATVVPIPTAVPTSTPIPTQVPTVTPVPTPTEVAQIEEVVYTLQIILGPDQEVGVLTEDDIDAAVDVMIDRLSAAGIGFNLLTDYDAEEMTFLTDAPSEEIVPLITTVGFLELVDFSGLDEPPLEGDCILTSAQQERYANQRICLSLETGEEPLTAPDGSPFPTVITGDGVVLAEASLSGQVGSWQVTITLDEDAAAALGDFTEAHIGESLAIVLDGEVIAAPVIQARVGDQAVIAGDYSAQEAQDLARILNTHALPFSIQMIGIDSLP